MNSTKIVFGYELSNIRTMRSSVVPYVIKKSRSRRGIVRSEVHFLFGIDRKSGDLTDFGGGVRKTENALLAALREFREEAGDIFGGEAYESPNKYGSCISVTNGVLSTLFVPVNERYHREMIDPHSTSEISGTVWVTPDVLRKLLSGRCHKKVMMWGRLRNFYKSVNLDGVVSVLLRMDGYIAL